MQKSFNVIPAKAGIQVFQDLLDPGCHRGGGFVEFCKRLRINRIKKKGIETGRACGWLERHLGRPRRSKTGPCRAIF